MNAGGTHIGRQTKCRGNERYGPSIHCSALVHTLQFECGSLAAAGVGKVVVEV